MARCRQRPRRNADDHPQGPVQGHGRRRTRGTAARHRRRRIDRHVFIAHADVGPRYRRPTQGRPRRRHLSQSDHRRRSSGSDHPQGWRRLLHDVLVVPVVPGTGALAFHRPGQLGADRTRAAQAPRRHLGGRPMQARRPLFHLPARQSWRQGLEDLRDLDRRHPRRGVERSDRPRHRQRHRSRPRGRRRRQALSVRQRHPQDPPARRRHRHRRRTAGRLPAVALPAALDHRELRAGRPQAAVARWLAVPGHCGRRHRWRSVTRVPSRRCA